MNSSYDSIGGMGMMDKCYFTGKSELLNWLNSYFNLNVSRIEDCASGAIYCQIADAVYYYQVPMKNVNWGVKHDFQYLHNYKLLQQVFGKVNQPKYIDINKLIKGKYQDNLEFLQWMKGLFDESGAIDRDYDAIGRRSLGKGPFPHYSGQVIPITSIQNSLAESSLNMGINTSNSVPTSRRANNKTILSSKNTEMERLKKALSKEMEEKEIVDKERMFYFNKLRAIEILYEELNEKKIPFMSLKDISEILYDSNDIDLESFSKKIIDSASINSNGLTSTTSGTEDQ
ncbi:EB1 like microtubule binding protein [Cryptosporidium ubiquitum]|uniref:EB1 like microtubule binding protein n=1 Tax=Cryptosporidium ubiquitum TaxID=857276 RepID=A0A1J4MIU1_9CRYT|nr:EB1 like microtubule binding protein [Cryptosporidium ubiquitum]OII74110.1 EB1 like microtubule binding protein [Cryptosporidium ubiquitum]